MEQKNPRKILNYGKIICAAFLFIFFAGSPDFAKAATLYFTPSAGSYAVGSTFAVNIYVSSIDQAVNAVSGIVSFPQNLQALSISETGSIIDTWVDEPSFSNSAGTVNFEGIIFNPGFTGASGKVIAINFKVLSAGDALVNFSAGSALANDGIGTDVLTSMGTTRLNLSAPSLPAKNTTLKPSNPSGSLPAAPKISSTTHPDSSNWYNNVNPKFAWELPEDIIAVKALYNKSANSQPTVVYKPVIFQIDITSNLKDGVYYFHLQFENNSGWGPVSHFRFQIDSQPPEPFIINLADGKETDNPRPAISFGATDALSGIDHYKIKINSGTFLDIPAEQIINGSYILPLQSPGVKEILVMALDKAGNYAVAYTQFTVKSINPPVITDYPQKLENSEFLQLKGTSYPNSQIIIWHQGKNEAAGSWAATSDNNGNFAFTAPEELKNGVNRIWAQVVDNRGAKSDNSTEITVIEHKSIISIIQLWLTNNIIMAFLYATFIFLLIIFLTISIYNKKIKSLKVPVRQKR